MTSPSSTPVAPQFDSAEQQGRAATLGIWVFLASELLFFGPLLFGYLFGRVHYGSGFALASRHTDVIIGSANTAILLTSSVFMAAAVQARQSDRGPIASRLLALTALLGLAFLVLKGVEYTHDWQEGLVPGAGFALQGEQARGAPLFYLLYFILTLLHGLHLTIGILLTAVMAWGLHRHALNFSSARRIELVGLYWHFVDIVWIFLYPLLYLVGRAGS